MDKLRLAITNALTGVKAAVNTAIKGLPPVEQFEANSELVSGLRIMNMYGCELLATLDRIAGRVVDTGDAEMTAALAEINEKYVGGEVTAGNLFRKSDHEAAINAAVSGARTTIEEEITARFERKFKAGEKRAELLKDVPTVLAEKVPDDVLLADGAVDSVKKFKDRLAKCTAVGVTLENSAGFLAEVSGLTLDDAGDNAFKAKVQPIEISFSAAKTAGGGSAGGGKPTNPAAGLGGGGTGEGKPRVRVF